MTGLPWALFVLALMLTILSTVLSLRAVRNGKATMEWVEEVFPDAWVELPEDVKRRGPKAALPWLDDHIAFPDGEFAERLAAYNQARKRSTMALIASLCALTILLFFGPEAGTPG